MRESDARVLEDVGAKSPVTPMGEGSGGRVYVDSRGRAYKVPNGWLAALWLSDEADWLKAALKIKELRPFLPKFYKFHRAYGVIEREFVFGDVAVREELHHYQPLFRLIDEWSRVIGWTGPEYSASAFVFRGGDRNSPVLVDHGLAHRVGPLLVDHVEKKLSSDLDREEIEYLLEQIEDSLHNGTVNGAQGGNLRGRLTELLGEVP